MILMWLLGNHFATKDNGAVLSAVLGLWNLSLNHIREFQNIERESEDVFLFKLHVLFYLVGWDSLSVSQPD